LACASVGTITAIAYTQVAITEQKNRIKEYLTTLISIN
jgi:hypothetical protein